MPLKDIKKPIGGLNMDDNPSVLPQGDYPDALNVRTGSSNEQHGIGNLETLQGELEVLLNITAEFTTYYGDAIGGEFLYTGLEEVKIGNQVFLKNNWDDNYPGSKTYDDEDNADEYGRLYTHNQAMAEDFCPEGYHIPTEADIDELLTFLGGELIAGGKMKELWTEHWLTPNTDATNSSGFKGLPGGMYDIAYKFLQEMGLFWLADEGEPLPPTIIDATDILFLSFVVNWLTSEGATGYRIDVAEDEDFLSMVAGYDNLDVGNVLTYDVTGLAEDTTYYVRVRAYNEIGIGEDSDVKSISTIAVPGDMALDYDGNEYHAVTIGTQQWLIENLRTEHYADGTPIPNLVISNYTDWFLPSMDELNEMYVELKGHGLGGFNLANYYFSSSEWSATGIIGQLFSTGNQTVIDKGGPCYVRACRSFIAGVGAYSLRDIGPAGGLIFYIDGAGTTYYEAAPTDQSTGCAWSNIGNVAIGTTSYIIGEGQNNTNEIIGQAGHTDSAAKLCNDLSIGGWINDTDGAMCYYDNDEATYKTAYGALYSWYAVDNAHGLAIAGWRVPSNADWSTLETFLGGAAVAAGKLSESGLTHWITPNTGATDEYGFKALPCGRRGVDGIFSGIGYNFIFWSSTELPPLNVYSRYRNYVSAALIAGGYSKKLGSAIRLMRDL